MLRAFVPAGTLSDYSDHDIGATVNAWDSVKPFVKGSSSEADGGLFRRAPGVRL
jgi:hypothetical protein